MRPWQIAHHQARKKSIEDARARYKEDEMPKLMPRVIDCHRPRGALRFPLATRGRGYHTDGKPGETKEKHDYKKENVNWKRMWQDFRAADMYWAALYVGLFSSVTVSCVVFAWNLVNWCFTVIKEAILRRRLNLSSYVAMGYAEALLFCHHRMNVLEEVNDLTVLYFHAQKWAQYTKTEKEESIQAFVLNRLCRYIKLPDYPIRTSRDATLFLRQTITCYVNCLKDDQHLMEKYKLLCLQTLMEMKDMNAAASFDPKLVAIAMYAEEALKSTARWKIDNLRLLEIEVLEEADEESDEEADEESAE